MVLGYKFIDYAFRVVDFPVENKIAFNERNNEKVSTKSFPFFQQFGFTRLPKT